LPFAEAILAAAPRFGGEADALPLCEGALAQARAAWPGVRLADEPFGAHLGAKLAGSDAPTLAAALAAVQVDDLFLACACLAGDPGALAAFDRAMAGPIAQAAAEFRLATDEAAELTQGLRVTFVVKRSLAGYSGRGPLRGWVRASAHRAALHLVEKRARRPDDEDDILGALPATGDVELDAMRRRFSAEFRTAFTEAVAALAPADRTLLAQHYVDDLSIDQLAVVLGVHRATAARRIVKLREDLLEGTRTRLRGLLAVDVETLESLMRVAASRLDVSVFRLLKP
jgi:RNA polymerase sigma-70 factor (ECF subfamily)